MKKIAITGLSGELGNNLTQVLNQFPGSIIDLYHSSPTEGLQMTDHVQVNLIDTVQTLKTLDFIQPDVIIHMAGATHIDACEADRTNKEEGMVWRMNVSATAEIAKYCAQHKTHLIYLSTECVFDGSQNMYLESDSTHPINWYGVTKAAAEQEIQDSGCLFTILRAVIAYSPNGRNTLWQKINQHLQLYGTMKMATDHNMTPTYLSDICKAVVFSVQNTAIGIYHVTPSFAVTPYLFAQKVASVLGFRKDVVLAATLEEIVGTERAKLRLINACLDSKETRKKMALTFQSIDDVIKML